jgi:transposase
MPTREIINKKTKKFKKSRELPLARMQLLTDIRHLEGILAYFDFDGLSTGPLEGTNNKIKTMQRKAYGL